MFKVRRSGCIRGDSHYYIIHKTYRCGERAGKKKKSKALTLRMAGGAGLVVSFHTGVSLLGNNIYLDERLVAARDDDEALQRLFRPI